MRFNNLLREGRTRNTGPKTPVSKGGVGVNNTPKTKIKFSELLNRDFYPVMKLNKPSFELNTVASESPSKRIKQTNCSTETSTFPDN